MDPRRDIWDLIDRGDVEELLHRAAVLHGHYCPGLALGVKGGYELVKRLDLKSEGMEDVLAVVETNNCASDGVQFVTGCSFGNNSLIFKDLGKTAFTLSDRDGKGLRARVVNKASEYWEEKAEEFSDLYEKVVDKREGDEEDKEELMSTSEKASLAVINTDVGKIFDFEDVEIKIPDYAPIHDSYICDICGEKVMATRTVKKDGEIYCLECAEEGYSKLTGYGIERK
ncbi:MAG: TraR/DksA C4-type zinc finger protein [Candidatus Thermoplasmatota archaeon]|nr:TraR/DksA C4-type zinc finger protein [Candidatus Thermoplasmatota archaeon]MBS3789407.1 TraR/DksA C4-type zinc finger protein [Candidatus Thermoplasmatota archaeon]